MTETEEWLGKRKPPTSPAPFRKVFWLRNNATEITAQLKKEIEEAVEHLIRTTGSALVTVEEERKVID